MRPRPRSRSRFLKGSRRLTCQRLPQVRQSLSRLLSKQRGPKVQRRRPASIASKARSAARERAKTPTQWLVESSCCGPLVGPSKQSGLERCDGRSEAGLTFAKRLHAPHKASVYGHLNQSPRLPSRTRTAANMGERARKRWASRDGIRACSRLFVGLETANGRQRARKGTAKDRSLPRADERQSRLWARFPRFELVRRAWDAMTESGLGGSWAKCWRRMRNGTGWRTDS